MTEAERKEERREGGKEGGGKGEGTRREGREQPSEPGGRGARPGVQAGASVQSSGPVLLLPRSPWPGGGGEAASPVYVFF